MTFPKRPHRNFQHFLGLSILLAVALAAGCSDSQTSGGSATNMNHVLPSGESVPGWLVVPSGGTHSSTATQDFIANGSSGCAECHGSDLKGGISGVSCFTPASGCHHGPVTGWVAITPAAQQHGASAKRAPGSSGFASCQICHGSDYSGGGANVRCSVCHGVNAPHPPGPWRTSAGSTYTHTDTNNANASVCRGCHFPGSPNNPANHPATPAPAGTAPGCFNSTLCHGEATVPHPVDNAWVTTPPAAQPHGDDAKATPSSTTGFDYCQVCHGTGTTSPENFGGGSSGVSCYPCHGSSSPHPSAPWRASAGSPYNHTNVNGGNAAVCQQCHFPGSPNNPPNHPPTPPAAGAPAGCFNNTLCHGAGVPHPVDNAWVTTPPAAQPHGDDAKATPSSTTGFDYCKDCHGTGTAPPANFGGGSSGVSCYPCHGSISPHPSAPWRASAGSDYNHTNVSEGNAAICQECHFPDSANNPPNHPATPAPAGTPAGCFNNTLCHGAGVPHPVGVAWVAASPALQPHGNEAKAAPGATAGYLYCQGCHGTGTAFPANFSGGSSGVSCYPCHGSSSPHPSAPWRTSAGSVYNHTDVAGGNAAVCQQCHFPGSPNNPPNHPPSPPAAGAPAGCFNSTLCHGIPGAVAHPVPFNDAAHFAVNTGPEFTSCSSCHDESAPSSKSGPVCQSCHAAASPLAAAGCTSCHASPPDGGAGAAYANIAGAHAVHLALNGAGSPVTCDTCHNGLGPSTANLNHYDRAKSRVPPGDAAFLSTYNAQSGASSFAPAAFSCSNVSCHGGQATPNWQTGTLNVDTQCTNCHTDGTTTQFNGPASTNHNRGPHQAAACTDCHNTTPLAANHFTNLATPALEGPASATISGTLIVSYEPATRSCTPACHGNETW